MNAAGQSPDKPCQVVGCKADGSFGLRRNPFNWREGYLWWCAAHRGLMPAPEAKKQAVTSTLDKGGQGRLI